jgi:hypothetical protein
LGFIRWRNIAGPGFEFCFAAVNRIKRTGYNLGAKFFFAYGAVYFINGLGASGAVQGHFGHIISHRILLLPAPFRELAAINHIRQLVEYLYYNTYAGQALPSEANGGVNNFALTSFTSSVI